MWEANQLPETMHYGWLEVLHASLFELFHNLQSFFYTRT